MNKMNKAILIGLAALLILALVAGSFVAYRYHMYFPEPPVSGRTTNEEWAHFGEFFGGTLSAIFGFLSLLALLLTLFMQRYQLVQAEEVSRATDAELRRQRAALSRQTFESTFFSLLEFHQGLVRGIDLVSKTDPARVTRGRDCLRVLYKRLLSRLKKFGDRESRREMSHEQRVKQIRDAYGGFWARNNSELAHYFRTLYRIFKFIDEAEVFAPGDEKARKQEYAGIARAQISNPELALLFYNGLSSEGEKFKTLIERYKVLENMTLDDLHDAAVDVRLYERSAYGTNPLADYFFL